MASSLVGNIKGPPGPIGPAGGEYVKGTWTTTTQMPPDYGQVRVQGPATVAVNQYDKANSQRHNELELVKVGDWLRIDSPDDSTEVWAKIVATAFAGMV